MQATELVGSRWKPFLRLIAFALFAGMGVWLIGTRQGAPAVILGFGVVSLGGAAALLMILRIVQPPRLRLTDEALIYWAPLKRSQTLLWRDLEAFLPFGSLQYVAYRLTPAVAPAAALGAHGVLGTDWRTSPSKTVDLLNARLEAWRTANA